MLNYPTGLSNLDPRTEQAMVSCHLQGKWGFESFTFVWLKERYWHNQGRQRGIIKQTALVPLLPQVSKERKFSNGNTFSLCYCCCWGQRNTVQSSRRKHKCNTHEKNCDIVMAHSCGYSDKTSKEHDVQNRCTELLGNLPCLLILFGALINCHSSLNNKPLILF